MELLHFLAELRNPVFDFFFSLVTRLGEETVFILVGLLFFWCIDKKKGYYILSVGFLGTLVNQVLKLLFRIPRPWVRDPSFSAVESAIPEATGYSFPSGHTQSSVGVFGSIARLYHKRKAVLIPLLVICVVVPFSRLYLGVHTLLDVGVSVGIALILIFGVYPILETALKTRRGAYTFFGTMLFLAACYLVFVHCFPFPEEIDPSNYQSGVKNAYKIFGCTLGLLLAYAIDDRYLHFETHSTPVGQILKFVLGLIPLLAVKEGLRYPLSLLLGTAPVADAIRYFLLTAVAGAVWPLTFPWFSRIKSKRRGA